MMEKTLHALLIEYKQQMQLGDIPKAYHGIMQFMMNLRTHFAKEYPDEFVTGSIHPGYMDFTYFPFTPRSLKALKLKIGIMFNHRQVRFEIWLAGQNRRIQKKYWELFKGSDWDKYHIPTEIKEGFSIVDAMLVERPDFDEPILLIRDIESNVLKFIKDIEEVLV